MKRWFGWIFLGFLLASVNFTAVMLTWRMAKVPEIQLNPWGGPSNFVRTFNEHYADGRVIKVETVAATGVTRRIEIEPWTYKGLASVWSPVVAVLIYTLVSIGFVRRDGLRAIIHIMRLHRFPISAWMILIAIFSIEFVLIQNVANLNPEPLAWIQDQFAGFLTDCGVPHRILKKLLRNREINRAASATLLVLGLEFLVLIPLGLFLSYVRPLFRQTPSGIDHS